MKANRFFEQGMLSYYQKDFSGAMYYFRKVLEIAPEDGAPLSILMPVSLIVAPRKKRISCNSLQDMRLKLSG